MKMFGILLVTFMISILAQAQETVTKRQLDIAHKATEDAFSKLDHAKNEYFGLIRERQSLLDTKFKDQCVESKNNALICSTAKDPKDSLRLRDLNNKIRVSWTKFQAARNADSAANRAYQMLVNRTGTTPPEELLTTTEEEAVAPAQPAKKPRWWNRKKPSRAAASSDEE